MSTSNINSTKKLQVNKVFASDLNNNYSASLMDKGGFKSNMTVSKNDEA